MEGSRLSPAPQVLLGDVPYLEARAWRNDPSIWHWCRQYTHLSAADHDRRFEGLATDRTVKMFGIYEGRPRSTSGAVGVCGFTSIDRVNQSAEFSLYIAPGCQRRGLGRAALIVLLQHGFQDHNFNRIWGETFDGNPALDLFIGLGMQLEGVHRQSYFRSGRFINSVIVSMVRGDKRDW